MYIHVYVHVGAQGKNAKFKVRKREVAKSSSTKVRLNNAMMLAGEVVNICKTRDVMKPKIS